MHSLVAILVLSARSGIIWKGNSQGQHDWPELGPNQSYYVCIEAGIDDWMTKWESGYAEIPKSLNSAGDFPFVMEFICYIIRIICSTTYISCSKITTSIHICIHQCIRVVTFQH